MGIDEKVDDLPGRWVFIGLLSDRSRNDAGTELDVYVGGLLLSPKELLLLTEVSTVLP